MYLRNKQKGVCLEKDCRRGKILFCYFVEFKGPFSNKAIYSAKGNIFRLKLVQKLRSKHCAKSFKNTSVASLNLSDPAKPSEQLKKNPVQSDGYCKFKNKHSKQCSSKHLRCLKLTRGYIFLSRRFVWHRWLNLQASHSLLEYIARGRTGS